MQFTITVDNDLQCINSYAKGAIDMASLREYFSELAGTLKETGIRRVLVDGRDATIQLTATDVFSIPRMVAEVDGLAECRRAMVAQPGVSGPELFAMVSQTHDQRVRIFHDYDEALAWMLSEDD